LSLFDVDGQQHLWMDVAAYRESPGIRKRDMENGAGLLLLGIIIEIFAVDINLMDKLILIAEIERGSRPDGDFIGVKGAAILDDRIRIFGNRFGRASDECHQ
ncbi:MAG TPA: hypothetical protein VGK90_02860, partial [Rhizomicrobium sp.]